MKFFITSLYFLLNVNFLSGNVSYSILGISDLYFLNIFPWLVFLRFIDFISVFKETSSRLVYSFIIFYIIDFCSHLYCFISTALLGFDSLFLSSTFSRRKLKTLIFSFNYFQIHELKSLNFSLSAALATCHKFQYTISLSLSSNIFY